MFDISGNGIITLTRGDSFSLDVFVNLGTKLQPIQYVLQPGDKLYFALMEPNQSFEHALIRKEFTNENLDEDDYVVMDFSSEMTEFLMPGQYYYMIKLVRTIDDKQIVDTITSKTKFFIVD